MPIAQLSPSIQIARYTSGVELFAPQEVAPWGAWLPSPPVQSVAIANTQPITELARAKTGSSPRSFGISDWYNRIHINPLAFDVGTVVSLQSVALSVWNAYLYPQTLNSILSSNADGITISQPAPAPLIFPPLKEHSYTLNVSTDGPATIDAAFLFTFEGDQLTVTIVGSRITPWVWMPDWTGGMIERLEWMTDILRAYDGTEQRVSLRSVPRRTIEFDFSASGNMRRILDSALYGWGARQWAVPIWPDGTSLSADLQIGDISIALDPNDRDYHVGGLAMILATDGSYEVAEISSVNVASIGLARPLTIAWAKGTMVFPTRAARLPKSHGFRRFDSETVYGRASMEIDDTNDWPAASETLYRTAPVLESRPNWIEDPDQEFDRKLSEIDFGMGVRAIVDAAGTPEIRHTHRWLLQDRAALGAFRSWLYARAGKFSAVWVPTWNQDVVVASIIGAQAAAIDINYIGYSKWIGASINRQDIRIQLSNGSVFYRRIQAAVELPGGLERLSIDAPLGIEINPSEVAMVSYMALCRLDSDGVELAWFTGDSAECAHPMRAIKHDL